MRLAQGQGNANAYSASLEVVSMAFAKLLLITNFFPIWSCTFCYKILRDALYLYSPIENDLAIANFPINPLIFQVSVCIKLMTCYHFFFSYDVNARVSEINLVGICILRF